MPEFEPTVEQIHQMEQRWAYAEQVLDGMLDAFRQDIPKLFEITGLSDGSIAFDYVYTFIMGKEAQGSDHRFTVALCAAAMTRLARASRADEELLTRLDKEINDNDEH